MTLLDAIKQLITVQPPSTRRSEKELSRMPGTRRICIIILFYRLATNGVYGNPPILVVLTTDKVLIVFRNLSIHEKRVFTNLDKNPRFLCLHDKKKTTSLTLALFGTRSSIIICIFRLLRSIVNRL